VNNWIRNIITVVLLLALATQNAGKLLLVIDYYANKTIYLANCENKSRPQLHCNGQCLLMKKLQKEDRKEQQSPEKKLEWKLEVLSRKSFYSCVDIQYSPVILQYFVPGSTGKPIDINLSIFRPPAI
jgi:hypothetical protein